MAGVFVAGVFVAMVTVVACVWLVILGGRGTVTEDTVLLCPICGGLPFTKLCPVLVCVWMDGFSFTVLAAADVAAFVAAAGAGLRNSLELLAATWWDSREEALAF